MQVMSFADRLEMWNPGALPPSLTLEKLRHPHGSVPFNPQPHTKRGQLPDSAKTARKGECHAAYSLRVLPPANLLLMLGYAA